MSLAIFATLRAIISGPPAVPEPPLPVAFGPHYLSPAGQAMVKQAAEDMGEELARRRHERAPAERRAGGNDRRKVDRRGFHTTEDLLAAAAVKRDGPNGTKFRADPGPITDYGKDSL